MIGLGDQLETMLKEFVDEHIGDHDFKDDVESAVDNYDFSDIIKDAIRDEIDVERAVSQALDEYDFSDAFSDQVAVYDWWDGIEDKIKDELESEVELAVRKLSAELDKRFDSPDFKELVKSVILEIVKDKLAELRQRVEDCLKWPWKTIKSLLARLKGLVRPN